MTRAKKKNIWKEIETVRNLIKRHVDVSSTLKCP